MLDEIIQALQCEAENIEIHGIHELTPSRIRDIARRVELLRVIQDFPLHNFLEVLVNKLKCMGKGVNEIDKQKCIKLIQETLKVLGD